MLGILGGMGPMATVDFMRKLVENTPADRDQDHLDVVARSAAAIPDRTDFILGGQLDPYPAMLSALRDLEAAGANVVAMPCNTAHRWHARLQASTELPILHIVDAVVAVLARQNVRQGRIGALATSGTVAARVYQDRLEGLGFQCAIPDQAGQGAVTAAIRLVKAGNAAVAALPLLDQAQALRDAGCTRVVMACTEIPVALAQLPGGMPEWLLDATDALARAAVWACQSRQSMPVLARTIPAEAT